MPIPSRPAGRMPIIVGIAAVAIVAATILHIGNIAGQVRELEEERDAQTFEIRRLGSAIAEIESASGDLERELDRFDYENWQDVVPDVRSAAAEVEGAAQEAQAQFSRLR